MTDKQKTGTLVEQGVIVALAKTYDVTPKAFEVTFREVAMPKPHTDMEFVSCCLVAREHGLNPLTKEIYFMRDKHGGIQAIVGVDGWIKKCNEHPQFDGMEFVETIDESGLVSVTTKIHRKDRKIPTAITEYMSECIQKRSKPGPWQTHPTRMLRWRSLCQCARVAFGFAGIMLPDEFEAWDRAKDITPHATVEDLPDIPDVSDTPVEDIPEEPEAGDVVVADPEGLIEKIKEDIAIAVSGDDPSTSVAEVAEQYQDLIERLPESHRGEAEKILETAA